MSLLGSVSLDLNASKAKYVVVKIGHGIYVMSDGSCGYHFEIVDIIKRMVGPDRFIEVRGGGFVQIDTARRQVTLSGESSAYGAERSRSETAALIRQRHPDYNVTIGD